METIIDTVKFKMKTLALSLFNRSTFPEESANHLKVFFKAAFRTKKVNDQPSQP